LAQEGGERSVSCPGYFTPGEKNPSTNFYEVVWAPEPVLTWW